jgi:hypothetical protein
VFPSLNFNVYFCRKEMIIIVAIVTFEDHTTITLFVGKMTTFAGTRFFLDKEGQEEGRRWQAPCAPSLNYLEDQSPLMIQNSTFFKGEKPH